MITIKKIKNIIKNKRVEKKLFLNITQFIFELKKMKITNNTENVKENTQRSKNSNTSLMNWIVSAFKQI